MPRQPQETRRRILDAAFWEIYRNGFQRASIDRILQGTSITKGALFHHFPTKHQLGYAVVDEIVGVWVREHWIDPLAGATDAAAGIAATLRTYLDGSPEEIVHGGCPLNNLAQEMAGIDEGFRMRLEAVADEWRSAVAAAWRQRGDADAADAIDADDLARFVVASIQGVLGSAKAGKSRAVADRAAGTFAEVLGRFGGRAR
jgi:AcrR family transcriptional regulator